jgi:dipeptidyl aminopeptidase/acylaminoacyl peptidase
MKTRIVLVLCAWAAGAAGAAAQSVVPPDSLVLDGIPAIPQGVAERVGRYTEFRSAVLADWHPARKEMLVLTRFADTPQVHHVAFPGGARTQRTFFKDSVVEASYEPTAGKYVLFSRSAGGNERYQLYRLDLDSGAVTLLTDGKSRNNPGRWSHRGDRYAYTSTRRNGADTDLYVMNPADPKSDQLVLEVKGGGWHVLDWAPDDAGLLVGEYVSANESHLHRLDLAKKSLTRLTPSAGGEPVAYPFARFSKDGKAVYLTTDLDAEFHYLATLDPATGKIAPLARPAAGDVETWSLSPDGQTIACTVNAGGVGKLLLVATKDGKVEEPKDLPAGSVLAPRWHPHENVLGFQVVSAGSPPDVYSLDGKTSAVSRWTHSETGGLVTRDLREPRLIRWKSFDGREITGFLYTPPARFTGKRPVVIDVHGGPEGQSRPAYLGRKNYFLDEMGVALLFPNVRGSAGFGKTFLKLDNGLLREGSYKDIGALFDWIAAQPDLDADRVMVTGGSYGGFMTLAVACNYADRIRCAVDVVGISNFVTFLQNTESYRRDLRRAEYGDERDPKVRAFLEKIAPLNNVAKMTKPMFIIQGKNDPRVPLSEAEQMVAALKKQGTTVWYLVAKDEGHGFVKKQNADFQFYATVRFMEEYLLK